MKNPSSASASGTGERAWPKIIANYRKPHRGRSAFELAVTVIPFAGLWALSWVAVHYGFWWGLLLTIPAAGFLLRLFMIQHDCGHGSFFAHRRSDDWTGRAIGVLTLTPYDYWRRAHAAHHASAGNLDERGVGDITTLTVAEYRALSLWGRLGYRLYRHPLVMFGIGPIWLFLFKQRLPFGMMRVGRDALGVDDGDQSGDRRPRGRADLADRHRAVPAGASADRHCWRRRPASGCSMSSISSRRRTGRSAPEWQFQHAALHGSSHYDLPARAQLADRQYRHPSCPSSVEQGAVLPAAGSAQGSSRAETVGRITIWRAWPA